MRHADAACRRAQARQCGILAAHREGNFGRVSKQQTLDAVGETARPGAKGSLSALKKADLPNRREEARRYTGWLASILRRREAAADWSGLPLLGPAPSCSTGSPETETARTPVRCEPLSCCRSARSSRARDFCDRRLCDVGRATGRPDQQQARVHKSRNLLIGIPLSKTRVFERSGVSGKFRKENGLNVSHNSFLISASQKV